MRSRLPATLLAALACAACGGRAATPVAAEPIASGPLAAERPAARPESPPATRPEPAGDPRPADRKDSPAPAAGRDANNPRAAGRGDAGKKPASPRPEERATVRHVLRKGQTLYSLAKLYDVPVETLLSANKITNPRSIRVGTPIFVPGARSLRDDPSAGGTGENRASGEGDAGKRDAGKGDAGKGNTGKGDNDAPRSAVREASVAGIAGDRDEDEYIDHTGPPDDGRSANRKASNHLAWPLTGAVTGPYGRRGKHGHHAGIDIDGRTGDPILAAASGVVVSAGPDGPYGRCVVIDHGDGLSTLYAHAEKLLVQDGETVHVGQRIALVGRSGNARGTHLHFEVRHDGRTVNPSRYLSARGPLTAGVH